MTELSLLTAKEEKPWDVVDPEALKEHVGHHAERSAHLYKEKGQIHLMSVTMPKE